MPGLSLFEPDQSRTLTYYDRCAIALNAFEMVACRIQIRVAILATPLSRSLNLRYPYSKEFYGYGQGFFQNLHCLDFPIEFTEQIIWDYWNEHSTISHQLTDVFQRLSLINNAILTALIDLTTADFPNTADVLDEVRDIARQLAVCFTFESPDLPPVNGNPGTFVNTFQTPINLLRFKFAPGTVFTVTIDSWTLGVTAGGSFPGNPETEAPYDTDNPNGNQPTPSGNRDPNGLPYGFEPPDSSPLDPTLDPDDFSNAPDPEPPEGTILLQGWMVPAIPGVQGLAYPVGCPGATIDDSLGSPQGFQGVQSLGTAPIRIDELGRVSAQDVLAAFPNFIFGAYTFGGDSRCGVNGIADF